METFISAGLPCNQKQRNGAHFCSEAVGLEVLVLQAQLFSCAQRHQPVGQLPDLLLSKVAVWRSRFPLNVCTTHRAAQRRTAT